MAVLVEGHDEPAHTGELVRRLREAAGLSVELVAKRAGITLQRLQALEAGEGVNELGYAEVCAVVRATQPPRPAWWSDDFEHDLTVTHLGPPATAAGRQYWRRIATIRAQLEGSGRGRPA